jgi:hypothetical protein
VSTATEIRPRRGPWRTVARGVVSVAVVAVIVCWFLISLALATLTCDDTCSADQGSWWGYPAQFALAAAGSTAGVIALVLGFRSRTLLYRALLVASLSCALGWLMWVFGGGNF